MIISVKFVERCPNNHRGEFIVLGPGRCEIQVSKRHIKTLDDLAEILLHELLHYWITMLQEHGLKRGIKKEHRYINTVVPMLINKLSKDYK